MKSLEDRLSQAVKGRNSLAADLAKGDLEREASGRYKGFVVRSGLSRVPNEAVKRNAFAREEEFRCFPCRYIESVKSPDGHVLRSNHDIREAFRVHFQDRFARLLDLPIQEFRKYLADFPRLQEAEAAGCEELVTECEVRDALKQVGLNKSQGLDGLPYEVYSALVSVPLVDCVRERVSAFADDITVFVSHRSDIEAVKKLVARYEQVAGAKINFDKSEGLR